VRAKLIGMTSLEDHINKPEEIKAMKGVGK
jgi:hypothetical protein